MKLKKIITMLITMIIMVSNIMVTNVSMATVENNELKIQTNKEYSEALAYGNARLRFIYSFYINEQGKEQPVYCVDKSLPGVESSEDKSYNVKISEKIDNEKVWKILHYSYPYVSITDMGCDNKYQCYVATQSALYCVLYGWNLNEYNALNADGEIIVKAIKNLMNYANNAKIKPNSSKIDIEEISDWELELVNDKTYLSRTFIATSTYMKQNYYVGLRGYVPIGSLITGIDNKEKREFKPNEQFKVLIPANKVTGANKIQIDVSSELSTFPIYKGVPKGEHQPYAITGIEFEDGYGKKDVSYKNIGGTLTINKLDGDTNEKLEGAVFKVYDTNGRMIVESEATNKDGQIKVLNLFEGKYYVEEIKAPEGYQRIVGKMLIPVFKNSTSDLKVMNNKTEVKEEEIHNVVVEIVENKSETTNKIENDYYKYEKNDNEQTNMEKNNTNIEKENNNHIVNDVQNNNVTNSTTNTTIEDNVKLNDKIQNNINTNKKLPKTGM